MLMGGGALMATLAARLAVTTPSTPVIGIAAATALLFLVAWTGFWQALIIADAGDDSEKRVARGIVRAFFLKTGVFFLSFLVAVSP